MTASIAAAQQVGTQIAYVAEAQDEVERLLEPDRRRHVESGQPSDHGSEDDDADTPIDGVPASVP